MEFILGKQDYGKTLLEDIRFISIDTETTGLKPDQGGRICEIAAVSYHQKQNKPLGFLRYLVNPQQPIPIAATKVNRITDETVKYAPTFDKVIPAFLNFIKSSLIIAYNADFDMYFINTELQMYGYQPLSNPVLDVLKLSKWLLQLKSYSLENVANCLNIKLPQGLNTHSALGDAILNARIFMLLIDKLIKLGNQYLSDVLKIAGDRKAECQAMVIKITDAIFREKKIKLVYFSLQRERTERIVSPLRLERRNQEYFLVAFCHLKNEERTFSLNRIEDLEIMS